MMRTDPSQYSTKPVSSTLGMFPDFKVSVSECFARYSVVLLREQCVAISNFDAKV